MVLALIGPQIMNSIDFGDISASTSAAPATTEPDAWQCLDGGADRIVMGMVDKLKSSGGSLPQTNTRVLGIRPQTPGDGNKVMLVDVEIVDSKPPGPRYVRRETREYSQVICTPAAGCLASVDLTQCKLSYAQRTAIRSLSYLASTKVAIKFTKRWWEDPQIMPGGRIIKGGVTSTDLPVRMVVYPSYGIDVEGAPGVLLASYNWSQDASVRHSTLAHETI